MPTAGETLEFEAPLVMEGTGVEEVSVPARTKSAGLASSGLGWRRSASQRRGLKGNGGAASGTADAPMTPPGGAKRPTEE